MLDKYINIYMERFQIDRIEFKTAIFRDSDIKATPIGGWVNAIRTTLGMTLAQLAKRVGTNASRINRIEKDEISGSVTLKTLQSVAVAMDSELVYAIVPKKNIESIIIDRYIARHIDKDRQISKHMNLEGQGNSEGFNADNIRIEDINFKGLWDD